MAIYTMFGSEVKVTKIIKVDPENDGPVYLEFYRLADGENIPRFESGIHNFKADGGIGEILALDVPISIE